MSLEDRDPAPEERDDTTIVHSVADLVSDAKKLNAYLIVVSGKSSVGKMFRLDRAEMTIGRGGDTDIVLDDEGRVAPAREDHQPQRRLGAIVDELDQRHLQQRPAGRCSARDEGTKIRSAARPSSSSATRTTWTRPCSATSTSRRPATA